ncbi:MAG: dihydrolipoyl dehydrogenase [Candidatus Omnitrophota bacterium]
MYDLAVIGAGWAGFNAGLQAKQLGLKTVIVDKSEIGGTCLNLGCIPTKTLIQSARVFNLTKKSSVFGLGLLDPVLDLIKIQERKDRIIQQLRLGMRFRLKGIDFLSGEAQLVSNQEIRISGDKIIRARNILIASGSKPCELAQLKFDGKKILSSNEALFLKNIPGSLLIIGGGVIGCEFAGLFSVLGSKVTIVEKMPQLLPGEDKEIARKIENCFKKKGIRVNTNTDVLSLKPDEFDTILVCIGRMPQIDALGLDNLGIESENGRIVVDEYLRVNASDVYAAGDCVSRIMLAHLAGYQGRAAVQNLAQPDNRISAYPVCVPSSIFTDPEIGSAGLNEEEAVNKGFTVDIYRFDFLGLGMARILDETDGFIKIVADKKSGVVLGASIIGPKAAELIGIFSLAIANSITVGNLRNTLFAHPTLSESISEALRN